MISFISSSNPTSKILSASSMTSAFKFLKTNDLVFYPYDAKDQERISTLPSIKAAAEETTTRH